MGLGNGRDCCCRRVDQIHSSTGGFQPERFKLKYAGDDGTEQREIVQFPNGWTPVLFWPPSIRYQRFGGIFDAATGPWIPLHLLRASAAKAKDSAAHSAIVYDIEKFPISSLKLN